MYLNLTLFQSSNLKYLCKPLFSSVTTAPVVDNAAPRTKQVGRTNLHLLKKLVGLQIQKSRN